MRKLLGKSTAAQLGNQPSSVQKPSREETRRRSYYPRFPNLSIRLRLPLLTALLLCGVIVVATLASYRGVKESALEAGHERLLSLTQQLSGLLQQSATTIANKTLSVANEPGIRNFVRAPSSKTRADAINALQPLSNPQDPNSWQVEIWNIDRSLLLVLPETESGGLGDLAGEFKLAAGEPFKSLGTIRSIKDSVAYPTVAAIQDDSGLAIGYLVRWRKLASTPDARARLTGLVGSNAEFYLGNSQGDLWTDLLKIVPKPGVDVRLDSGFARYERDGNTAVLALARPIAGTPWYVLVEFPESVVLNQAGGYLRYMTVIGLVLLIVGLACAFALSRSITRPLLSLTEAAAAISRGDYSQSVLIQRNDELGALACAFNTMVDRVSESQRELEKRIQERTAQLELSNKELESFSYSVSHDLRAPLRAINGFSRILIESHASEMSAEAARYLVQVRNSAGQMGQLVDDLLQFSRLGRQSVQKQRVEIRDLVGQVLNELQSEQDGRDVKILIGELPVVHADHALLKVVYTNLISNALKYTRGQDKARIEIGSENKDVGTVYYVKDNGAGFDMQYVDKLFGVFQRLHRAEEFEGTGVGLATAQRIIQRHGGHIWAEAEINKGAIFYFSLSYLSGERTSVQVPLQ